MYGICLSTFGLNVCDMYGKYSIHGAFCDSFSRVFIFNLDLCGLIYCFFQMLFPDTNKKTSGSLPKCDIRGRPSLTDANVWVKHAVIQPSTICVCSSDEFPVKHSHARGGHDWIFTAKAIFFGKSSP